MQFKPFCRKIVQAQSGTLQMSAACSSLLTQLICWPLGLQITEPIAMIFGMLEPPGVYWLAMTKL